MVPLPLPASPLGAWVPGRLLPPLHAAAASATAPPAAARNPRRLMLRRVKAEVPDAAASVKPFRVELIMSSLLLVDGRCCRDGRGFGVVQPANRWWGALSQVVLSNCGSRARRPA